MTTLLNFSCPWNRVGMALISECYLIQVNQTFQYWMYCPFQRPYTDDQYSLKPSWLGYMPFLCAIGACSMKTGYKYWNARNVCGYWTGFIIPLWYIVLKRHISTTWSSWVTVRWVGQGKIVFLYWNTDILLYHFLLIANTRPVGIYIQCPGAIITSARTLQRITRTSKSLNHTRGVNLFTAYIQLHVNI